LTLSAPITLGTAMSVLGRLGCYLKPPAVALDLSRVSTIAFDKTGTLTTAAAPVVVDHGGLSEADWRLVRAAAAESVHPVSRAIAGAGSAWGVVSEVVETPGVGLSAIVNGRRVRIGRGPGDGGSDAGPDVTGVAVDDARGWARVAVPARDGIDEAVAGLARDYHVQLLSGDHDAEAGRWRPLFGVGMAFRQTPDAKLQAVRELASGRRRVLMLGDGLNDAGALAAADVGVAVSDATACVVPACDAVVAGPHVRDLGAYLRYARRARHVIALCFAISVVYNVVGLTFALAGALTPLASAILMPVSSLTVIGISAGAMRHAAQRMLPS
jgi:Cu+-exporting ATPase